MTGCGKKNKLCGNFGEKLICRKMLDFASSPSSSVKLQNTHLTKYRKL